jgi:hypothetical protein
MQIGIHSLPARRWGRIGVVALLGLTLAIVTVSAGHANAGHAVVAKKKCKKKGKKSAEAAKKKKCKKKKKAPAPVAPSVPPPTVPVLRAEVSWTVANPTTDEADIDLHAWSSGAHTGYSEVSSGDELEIPGLVYQPEDSAPGVERLVDQSNPSTRPLTFTICSYYWGQADPAEVTYHFVFANGSVLDGAEAMLPGDIKVIDPQEGGSFSHPRSEWCPAPPP